MLLYPQGTSKWSRGEMENRIKECQGDVSADRTPTPTMRANQLRLWCSSFADVLVCAVRRIGLAGTTFERATCGTIRMHLLKVGALVTISVRRVKLAFSWRLRGYAHRRTRGVLLRFWIVDAEPIIGACAPRKARVEGQRVRGHAK